MAFINTPPRMKYHQTLQKKEDFLTTAVFDFRPLPEPANLCEIEGNAHGLGFATSSLPGNPPFGAQPEARVSRVGLLVLVGVNTSK